jgi:gamma-glutamyltranspeptidase/glutathione hydrolase
MIQNIVDYGMDMQQAIDTPRLFFDGDRTTVERGFPPATREGLTDRGHTLVDVKPPWGGAQTIKIDWDRGVLIGGSESRKDGCALGY